MNDALLVSRFERVGDLSRDRQRLVDRNGSASNSIGERWSLDQLQHQSLYAVRFFKAVDRGDVRVIERRQQLCFALETREAVGIGDKAVREDLERNLAVQVGIAAAIYLT